MLIPPAPSRRSHEDLTVCLEHHSGSLQTCNVFARRPLSICCCGSECCQCLQVLLHRSHQAYRPVLRHCQSSAHSCSMAIHVMLGKNKIKVYAVRRHSGSLCLKRQPAIADHACMCECCLLPAASENGQTAGAYNCSLCIQKQMHVCSCRKMRTFC